MAEQTKDEHYGRATKRIHQLNERSKELRAQTVAQAQRIAALEAELAARQTNDSLPENVIQRRVIEGIANEMARRDFANHVKRINELRDKTSKKIGNSAPHPGGKGINLPYHVQLILIEHPAGADVVAEFLRHPEVAREILSKPDHMHGAAIGELAERLTAKREPVASKAPKPVGGVDGKGKAIAPSAADAPDFQTYKAIRQAQMEGRRR